jgi:ABC-type bacteriocin/lantibiotic exporter with double-glycine peptidase domain
VKFSQIKQNITFAFYYNQIKYEKMVTACALEADLEILPAKDETEIGEKRINLSGSQKQRVSLAGTLYQDSDIYLLDKPLSAMDAHVAQILFQHVIEHNYYYYYLSKDIKVSLCSTCGTTKTVIHKVIQLLIQKRN